ncbi:MAG: HD-GYP domain-containing protein [Clostridiales bacterium]|jgi:putative nucleotidyltransferase with HDIG domain|nr:HD-GYP domain-containing protein [Eubacteriales bacterium]MDH7566651.1 HD-GYP domain-containing protein [Clostridiales bacterium]
MEILLGSEPYKISYLQKIYDLYMKIGFDSTTYKHCLNVALYSVQFGKSLGYCPNEALAYYSGLFHDIGKLQIDHHILNKTSALSKNEFNIMKHHPSYGYAILLQAGLPKEISEAVLHHHEHYDGTGYPSGLKGDKIPFLARMISVCDVFDALTSDRPYRKAYSIDKAMQIMNRCKGQFDPELLYHFTSKAPKILHVDEVKAKSELNGKICKRNA